MKIDEAIKNARERYKDPSKTPFFGKHHTEESKEKMSKARRKPVLNISENGDIICRFDSVIDASKYTGISTGVIMDCCKGRRVSYKGMTFAYESEYKLINTTT